MKPESAADSPIDVASAVAIVGIGCRFPGGVTDVRSFWQLLSSGGDAITEIPADRIDLAHYFDPRPATPGRIMTRWGGFLDRIEEFDAFFFGISPREAERLDPQQRLLLEIAWEALEDAGQDIHQLSGSQTAVFVGQWLSDFEARLFADPEALDFYMTTGSGRYAASGRLSYAFGFAGPSLTLDTACSSSLAAVHLAVRSIRSGESTLALAGGVNVILQPHISVAYSQSRMMAPDGHCKFGDALGDGYVRSEGAGLVVLKALDRAVADGDRIYAVIRGSALNNDGRSSGSMGTPSRIGQEQLLRTAYRDAGVSPGRVGYIEAHGTGTRAGDPVELGALGAVLAEGREPAARSAVGSVKTNIGHTEGAAGIAGLIKLALALHYESIPACLHCRELNPAVPWADAPFELARNALGWPRADAPRVGGVSAFGIAGTNAHVVLQEAPRAAQEATALHTRTAGEADAPALLVLSAKSAEALRILAARYAELLATSADARLASICSAAARRRTALEHRAAFVAADRMTLVDALRRYAGGEAAASANGVVQPGPPPGLAFVFPGQGAQFAGMARVLLQQEPVFVESLRRCDVAARPYLDCSIIEQLGLQPEQPGYRLDDIDVVQPVLVALALSYAALWESRGVRPDAVVGHSMGEVGAACVAGALSTEQAMQIICRRSSLMRRTSGRGAMALVELSMDEACKRIKGHEQSLAVAVSNSPRSSVISGDPEAVRQVMRSLEREQIFCRLVKVDVASHSPQMEPLAAELMQELHGLIPGALRIPIYSTVLARRADAAEFAAGYWARNMRQPVLFAPTVSDMLQGGLGLFLEMGPHPVLLPSIQQTAQAAKREAVTLACGRRDESEPVSVLTALAGLWAAGFIVDWSRWMPAVESVDLPLYPWQRERFWLEAAQRSEISAAGAGALAKPDEESLGWLHRLQWQESEPPDVPVAQATNQRWLIVCEDGPAQLSSDAQRIQNSLAAQLAAVGAHVTAVTLQTVESALRAATADGAALSLVVIAADTADSEFLPLSVLQSVLGVGTPPRVKLWFVTRGAQCVDAQVTVRVRIHQAALWGAARVVAEEHPQWWGGLIDLDFITPPDAQATALVRQLLGPGDEDQVALRGESRHVLRLVKTDSLSAAATPRWRADASYLISGGLGGVGVHIARAMAAGGARHLILLGRSGLPPRAQWNGIDAATDTGRKVAAVRSLEASGVTVHIARADAGDEAQMRAWLDGYAAEAWPAIRGVVHAAGVFNNHLAGEMSRAAFDASLHAKLRSAQVLDRLLPELDAFILFSSTGAFLAQSGQANYAAANAGLDALAVNRRARGQPALSIAWGVWRDTGLVKGAAGERNVGEMARQGIRSFEPERGAALFAWLCTRAPVAAVVLPIDWAAFRRARAGRSLSLYREVLDEPGVGEGEAALRERLIAAPPAQRHALLEVAIKDIAGIVLKIAPTRLDVRKALGLMGLNSLLAMELRNRLEAALGVALSATLAWNYPSIHAMAEHLVELLASDDAPGSEAAALRVDGAPEAHDESVDESAAVAALSDQEAARLLGANRKRSRR